MTRYTLPFALFLGLMLLLPSCRHYRSKEPRHPHYSHEEAQPVSELPHDEFSRATPRFRH